MCLALILDNLIKKALLCYNLCRSLLASQFLSDPYFKRRIPCFLRGYLSSVFNCAGNVRGWAPIYCLRYVAKDSSRAIRERGGGRAGSCRWRKNLCGCASEIILSRGLLRQVEDRSGSQSGSRSRTGLERRALRIMREYDLAIMIAIQLLTRPRTCERGSSSFVAISRLSSVYATVGVN